MKSVMDRYNEIVRLFAGGRPDTGQATLVLAEQVAETNRMLSVIADNLEILTTKSFQ